MKDTNLIAIHAKFKLHQPVTLYWEGESFPPKLSSAGLTPTLLGVTGGIGST